MENELILIVEDNPKNLKLVRDTLHATSTYALLTRVIFPICHERRLRRAYPLIVPTLKHVFTEAVLMGLCRLFEEKGHASLTTFLACVPALEKSDDEAQARRRFLQTIPQLRREIAAHWRRLVLHRTAWLACAGLRSGSPGR